MHMMIFFEYFDLAREQDFVRPTYTFCTFEKTKRLTTINRSISCSSRSETNRHCREKEESPNQCTRDAGDVLGDCWRVHSSRWI